jgi:hypothetical protein
MTGHFDEDGFSMPQHDDWNALKEDKAEKEKNAGSASRLKAFGNYPVLREIPAGNNRADIYLINQNGNERVLKLYKSGMGPQKEEIKNQKELSERLRSHIISIYAYGCTEKSKRWFEIKEYAKYGSIKDLFDIEQKSKILPKVVREITEGLKTLHGNNIFHLNLKPANILVRETQPLELAYSDFRISPVIEHELTKQTLGAKETLFYLPPEAFTGEIGKKSDYWSFGMIILELLLGKHPFVNLEADEIMHTLTEKGVLLPEDIPEDYPRLLKGLLTKEPEKRWGHREAKMWLEGDTSMPVYFSGTADEKGYKFPFALAGKEFLSIKEAVTFFASDDKACKEFQENLYKGNISEWLLKNGDKDTSTNIENMKKLSGNDADMAMIRIIYTFRNDLPFVLFGKLITPENLCSFAERAVKDENTETEETIVKLLINGKLFEYYREYMIITSKMDDELSGLFTSIMKVCQKQNNYNDKLQAVFKTLDVLINHEKYKLPVDVRNNLSGNLGFITDNIDLIMNEETYRSTFEALIIPQDMKTEIEEALSKGRSHEYINGLKMFHEKILITRNDYAKLSREYIMPKWLDDGISGSSRAGYIKALQFMMKLQNEGLLIKKNDFLDYLKKYSSNIDNLLVETVKDPVQNVRGETREDKMMRMIKDGMDNDSYIRFAKYIKQSVVLPMIPVIDKITAGIKDVPPYKIEKLKGYVETLGSAEAGWDELDKKILNEIHSNLFQKKNGFAEFMGKITTGTPGNIIRKFMKIVLGFQADEDTLELEWAIAGTMAGALTGIVPVIILNMLEIKMSFFGPVVLGAVLGAVRRHVVLALIAASVGFAGAYFLRAEMILEILYIFLITTAGGAYAGAFFGRKKDKLSFVENFYLKYQERIDSVLNSVPEKS